MILQKDIDFARDMGKTLGLEGVAIVDTGSDIREYRADEKQCLHKLAFRYALAEIKKHPYRN